MKRNCLDPGLIGHLGHLLNSKRISGVSGALEGNFEPRICAVPLPSLFLTAHHTSEEGGPSAKRAHSDSALYVVLAKQQ